MLNNNIELPHELHQTHNFDEDEKLTSSSSDEELYYLQKVNGKCKMLVV